MLDHLFLAINAWLRGQPALAMAASFLWGIVSVLASPCHLASIPLFIAYVAGQARIIRGREAAGYAGLFSLGLFTTIAAVGVICALLGRMLGDVGPYWGMAVGLLFLLVGATMVRASSCGLAGASLLDRLGFTGAWGALGLGLAYGVLSGACTFGFLAPMLAYITMEERVAYGILLILLFGLGHVLPITLAGSSAALIHRVLAVEGFTGAARWLRRGAGLVIAGLGGYFLVQPFW
jgi:cytochrome c-type biogenesis protein